MSRYRLLSIRDVEVQIDKYIRDASRLAEGVPIDRLGCWIDGIRTPAELSAAIRELGAAYLKRMSALRNSAPTVRGDTISIFQPQEVSPNAPSREDEAFVAKCRRQLREQGFVISRDADIYEEIAKKYPGRVLPTRVRGSEARRWLALQDPYVVSKKIKNPLAGRKN